MKSKLNKNGSEEREVGGERKRETEEEREREGERIL